jgi:hypothetical protein
VDRGTVVDIHGVLHTHPRAKVSIGVLAWSPFTHTLAPSVKSGRQRKLSLGIASLSRWTSGCSALAIPDVETPSFRVASDRQRLGRWALARRIAMHRTRGSASRGAPSVSSR